MHHPIKRNSRPEFGGPVEDVYVGDRRVGMVHRDPNPPAERTEQWMAYYRGGRGVDSREAGIRVILDHAADNPGFVLR
jgi:hypothetical protein